jgi:hypothetical protein
MKKRNTQLSSLLAAAGPAVAVLLTLAGCQTAPPWNLSFTANTAAPVRMDVVGINVLDKPDWIASSVDDYWTTGIMRKNADRLTFKLVNGKFILEEAKVPGSDEGLSGQSTDTLTIDRKNPVWKEWNRRNDAYLVVIGDFPGSNRGGPDLRKRILPLPKKYWNADDLTLRIQILDDQIKVLTPPSAKAAKMAP